MVLTFDMFFSFASVLGSIEVNPWQLFSFCKFGKFLIK